MMTRIPAAVRRHVGAMVLAGAVVGAFGGVAVHAQGEGGGDMRCLRLCLYIGDFPICLELCSY